MQKIRRAPVRRAGRMEDYTMNRTEIRTLFENPAAYADKSVTVCGWVRTIRDSKALGFIELNDGGCFKNLQIVFEDSKIDNFKEVAKYNVGSAICVTGTLLLTPQAKQPFEIHAEKIELEGASTPDYPLQKKRHTLEYLRSIAHLRPRTNTLSAVFRVRSVAAFAIHRFFNERGFVYAHTPLITASDCEGAGEMFRVTTLPAQNPPLNEDGSVDFSEDFFGKPANLTVSGQLEGEMHGDGVRQNLYLWSDLPRGEFQYAAPRRRILDDRAGNRVRGLKRRYGLSPRYD